MRGQVGRRPITPAEIAAQAKRERDRASRLRRKTEPPKPFRVIDGVSWLAGEPAPWAAPLVEMARVAHATGYTVEREVWREFRSTAGYVPSRGYRERMREAVARVREAARERA